MSGIELLSRIARRACRTPSCSCSRRTPTPTSRSPAINDIGLDHYLLKPWDPPDERLYPVVDDLLSATGATPIRSTRRTSASSGTAGPSGSHEVKIVPREQPRALRVARRRTRRRGGPPARPGAGRPRTTCRSFSCPTARRCGRRRSVAVATALGLRTTRRARPLRPVHRRRRARRAGRCGLRRVRGPQHGRRRADAPGGQAGQSAAIENYLGFPRGLSGADLAQRALAQARRFGAEMVLARDVVALEARGPVRAVRIDGGGDIEARSVILATGVAYRTPRGGRPRRARRARRALRRQRERGGSLPGDEVYVVGAANSAGQAVLNLARFAAPGHARRAGRVARGRPCRSTSSTGSARTTASRCTCAPRWSAPRATATSNA